MRLKQGGSTYWLRPIKTSGISKNLTGRKLALVVLGSNIWPVVHDHGAAIAAKVDAATPGSYEFVKMPLPPKRRKDAG